MTLMPAKRILLPLITALICSLSLSSCAQPAEETPDTRSPKKAASVPETPAGPRIGVWITVFSPEEVLSSKENTDKLISTCKSSGIDHIYLQVYRAGKRYYNDSPLLPYLLDKAQKKNIKVYAWINVLSIANNEEAPILGKHGRSVLTLDQHGRTSSQKDKKDELDEYYIRENQLFLEPGDKRVREHLVSAAEEIITSCPGFSGVHLDYIRYPLVVPFIPGSRFTSHGLSYGYTEANLAAFRESTGLDALKMDPERDNFLKWDDWRRSRVALLVKEISEKIRAISPEAEISCAIAPSIERTYLVTFQDWTKWLDEGSVDYVVAMNYTDDERLLDLNTGAILIPGYREKIYIGVGAYLLKEDAEKVERQISAVNAASPAGIVIFSYDDIASSEELQKFLSDLSGS